MIAFPNAKINIGLNILGKRPDGFHDIHSCFYPIPWCDVLEIIDGEKTSFHASGTAIPGESQDNLCLKAYQLLARDFELSPVNIYLHKVIPTGAGLGGGSSDAAFTLKLLTEKFQLDLSDSQLETYAARLGSDCAFFIRNTPAIATGRGEQLERIDLDLSGYHISLVNPGIHISTKEAYAKVSFSQPPDRNHYRPDKVKDWKEIVRNDFEDSLFPSYPSLGQIKEQLHQLGALYASMTGSGSTVYGISDKPLDLSEMAEIGYSVFQKELISP